MKSNFDKYFTGNSKEAQGYKQHKCGQAHEYPPDHFL